LTYSVTDTYFKIDSSTRVISTTSTPLDYESIQEHSFEVLVKDSGPTTGTTTLSIVVDVSVFINNFAYIVFFIYLLVISVCINASG